MQNMVRFTLISGAYNWCK